MNQNKPSHEEISAAAHSLWKDRGCPEGLDNEIWLEAERQLTSGKQSSGPANTSNASRETRDNFTQRAQAEAAAESRDEYNISAKTSDQEAIKAAVKAPQGPRAARGQPASTKGGSGRAGLG